ncbi:MAG: O-sialoglycoprotein endopeptidase [Eubacteriales bacterium]|nr:O-sialoglycoprotein endopeptidase [Eubacteriales bacterium]
MSAELHEGADLCLGIDTSNYKTSVALTDPEGNILYDSRRFLQVNKGMRGLRQSEALFQHVNALPDIIGGLSDYCGENIWGRICCVAVSSRPRSVEGSYMPAFLAGLSTARSMASALNVPCYKFSHQDGHIEAVRFYTPLKDKEKFISFHFSGGTTEAVVYDRGRLEIVGGTKDISFGQLLDRTGVDLGLDFPCGEELDRLALERREDEPAQLPDELCEIIRKFHMPVTKVKDGYINLSGAETYIKRYIDETSDKFSGSDRDIYMRELAFSMFSEIARAIGKMTLKLADSTGIRDFLFAGGVSSSLFIREDVKKRVKGRVDIYFGRPELSSDNAVGISLLGGLKHGAKANNSITA